MASAKKTRKNKAAPEPQSVPQPAEPVPQTDAPPNHPGGRPLLFKTVEELKAAVDGYFASCEEEEWHKVLKYEIKNMPPKLRATHRPSEDDYEWVPTLDRHGNIVRHQVKPYTIAGLAAFLNTTRETILDYQERPEFSDTIKEAKARCQAYAEEQLFEPKIAAGVIFNLKNNYGYKDKIDVTSDDKALPVPIINVHRNDGDEEDQAA